MNYAIFVTSDFKGKIAFEILNERIDEKKWLIFDKTRDKEHLIIGTKIIFYIAGKFKFSKSFYAIGEIQEIEKSDDFYDPEYNQYVSQFITFKVTKLFSKPIDIRSIKEKLNFIRKPKYYGLDLIGGVKIIQRQDFELIINSEVK